MSCLTLSAPPTEDNNGNLLYQRHTAYGDVQWCRDWWDKLATPTRQSADSDTWLDDPARATLIGTLRPPPPIVTPARMHPARLAAAAKFGIAPTPHPRDTTYEPGK